MVPDPTTACCPPALEDRLMQISILIGQVPVTWDVEANLGTLRDVVDEAQPGDLVVLPEGMLSGYGEDLTPLEAVDRALIDDAVAQVGALAVQRQVQIFCGSLLPWRGGWCNAGLTFTAAGDHYVYRKINLAMNERGRLHPGTGLSTVNISRPQGKLTVGVQLCREIRFPEQWQHLASAGAELFVYMTNAANTREVDGVWRSHLISRAAENQRFVVSANIAHPDQHCPSMVVSPRGEVMGELPNGAPGLLKQTLDLTQVGDWYLGQRRQDVLSIAYHGPE